MPAANLLLVEDDAKLAGLVEEYLVKEGFSVRVESRGDAAIARILAEQPDLVILDVMLPGADGFEVCRRVRNAYRGGILMLTARGEEIDEVLGLELGADDYVAKPVRPRLLLTRIRTLLRRGRRPTTGLAIDPGSRSVQLDGNEVELTSGEFDLLAYLANRRGQTVGREELYRSVLGMEFDGLDRSLDLRIARLRKKLDDDGKHPRWIKSVRGVGYLLVSDLR